MAISQSSLSSKIQTEIVNLYGIADDAQRLQDFADAIAKAIVDEIQQNAEVLPGSFQADGNAVTGIGTVT